MKFHAYLKSHAKFITTKFYRKILTLQLWRLKFEEQNRADRLAISVSPRGCLLNLEPRAAKLYRAARRTQARSLYQLIAYAADSVDIAWRLGRFAKL